MRGWIAALALTCAALGPAQAVALSCLDYSIRSSFWYKQESPDTYLLVLGGFSDLRKLSVNAKSGDEVWTGRFIGNTASLGGFDRHFDKEVRLKLYNLGPYYGGGELDGPTFVKNLEAEHGLVWLKETPTGYEAQNDLCAPLVDTSPESIKPALRCVNRGWCPKPNW